MVRKKIIVTGASGAIGRAIAEVFFSHNYDLILLGRNLKKLKDINYLKENLDSEIPLKSRIN